MQTRGQRNLCWSPAQFATAANGDLETDVRKCGCMLTLKAAARAFQCPLGKWEEVANAPEAFDRVSREETNEDS